MQTEDLWVPTISTYTRQQAIEDGVLVDLMRKETRPLVEKAGIKFPVAMTADAFVQTVAPIDQELPPGQDLKGRLWDILWMMRNAMLHAEAGASEIKFSVILRKRSARKVTLKVVVGPGDNFEPVLTIMLPLES